MIKPNLPPTKARGLKVVTKMNSVVLDDLCEVLKDEWKSLSREGDFPEDYYSMSFDFDGSWESFLDIWIEKAKEYGIYDGDVIESINTVADLFDDRIERQDEEGEDVEYDEKAWYNERENANYHSYDSYCILARYEYWMDFVRGGCKDPYECEDEEDYERAPSPVPSPKQGFSYGIF